MLIDWTLLFVGGSSSFFLFRRFFGRGLCVTRCTMVTVMVMVGGIMIFVFVLG